MPYARNTLPLVYEDRSGNTTNTDFDEMYERRYYHIARDSGTTKTKIYEMSHRTSRARPPPQMVLIELDFQKDESLGTISFVRPPNIRSMSMSQYLRKTSFFGPSTTRKFTGSDGKEYKWGFRTTPGQEWSCTNIDNTLVAHYDLKPPDVRTFGIVSGHNLTVYEPFAYLSTEVIATFLIMRQIQQYRL